MAGTSSASSSGSGRARAGGGSSSNRCGTGPPARAMQQPLCGEGGLGISLLRLGVLGRRRGNPLLGGGHAEGEADEDLVLELESDLEGGLRLVSGPSVSSARSAATACRVEAQKDSHRPIVEADLYVQEYFSADDAFFASRRQQQPRTAGGGHRSGSETARAAEGGTASDHDEDDDAEELGQPRLWAPPGATTGRKLMEARSRRCVICLADKQHTLVPPHRELESNISEIGATCEGSVSWFRSLRGGGWRLPAADGLQAPLHPSRGIEDHRFCTDCWEAFLQHRLRQRSAPSSLREDSSDELRCPVCRSAIEVPDVYVVRMGLPECWQRQAPPAHSHSHSPRALYSFDIADDPSAEIADLETIGVSGRGTSGRRRFSFAWRSGPAPEEAEDTTAFAFWALPRGARAGEGRSSTAGGGSPPAPTGIIPSLSEQQDPMLVGTPTMSSPECVCVALCRCCGYHRCRSRDCSCCTSWCLRSCRPHAAWLLAGLFFLLLIAATIAAGVWLPARSASAGTGSGVGSSAVVWPWNLRRAGVEFEALAA
mmetsp:Transcript_111344/g.359321  ORF Transcript_111344/g.359321 Transcript_111344/m.359321 type:complete len:541 (-) Transcript_111344:28-1650(-)